MLTVPQNWQEFLADELKKEYLKELFTTVDKLYSEKTIYPPKEKIFNALKLVSPADVKVVIIGQDPYHGEGQANGLAFSVERGVKIPPSLRNIYKELQNDLGITPPLHGDLSHWAKQGVLLINATFTVEHKKAGSHHHLNWQKFSDNIIKKLSEQNDYIIFILWGNYAKAKMKFIDNHKHGVLTSAHPSPLSAFHGFFGTKVFSRVNELLSQKNIEKIDWNIPMY